MKLLDPSNDLVFKLLFREPEDEQRLIAMLTAILEPPVPIRSAEVMNPELPADVVGAKSIRLDLLVELGDGRRVNVEMESWPKPVFIPREVFYWAKLHASQLREGADYDSLVPTIGIAWLGDSRGRRGPLLDPTHLQTSYRICELRTHVQLTDHLELHLLDLCNLEKDATLSPALRRWAEFFDHPTEQTLARLATEDPIMADTVHKLAAVSDDDATRRLAEARWEAEIFLRHDKKIERDEGRAEGRAEGIEVGRAEGIEVGRAEGIEVGRAEGLRAGVKMVLEVRFGALPADVLAQLDDADAARLDALAARARTIETLGALFEDGAR